MSGNRVVWHPSLVTREQREAANCHKAAAVWFTGLPASGKSTTAHAVERQLFVAGCQALVLDGDNVRHGLSSDLGFSPADRSEHLRRIGELTKFMAPYEEPNPPDLVLDTGTLSPERCTAEVIGSLRDRGLIDRAVDRPLIAEKD